MLFLKLSQVKGNLSNPRVAGKIYFKYYIRLDCDILCPAAWKRRASYSLQTIFARWKHYFVPAFFICLYGRKWRTLRTADGYNLHCCRIRLVSAIWIWRFAHYRTNRPEQDRPAHTGIVRRPRDSGKNHRNFKRVVVLGKARWIVFTKYERSFITV